MHTDASTMHMITKAWLPTFMCHCFIEIALVLLVVAEVGAEGCSAWLALATYAEQTATSCELVGMS